MKLLLVSDSHWDRDALERILMKTQADKTMDLVIHLGDGIGDVDPFEAALPRVLRVRGNCDFLLGYDNPPPAEITENVSGAKLFCCHGHTLGVKHGTDALLLKALSLGANAAFFGHTHEPFCDNRNGVLLLNPGAACDGRYAVIRITPNGALDPTLY